MVVDGASSATMVLLPKQVHLQNDVGATPYQRVSEHEERRDILAARDKERDERNVRRRKRRYGGLLIVGRWRSTAEDVKVRVDDEAIESSKGCLYVLLLDLYPSAVAMSIQWINRRVELQTSARIRANTRELGPLLALSIFLSPPAPTLQHDAYKRRSSL